MIKSDFKSSFENIKETVDLIRIRAQKSQILQSFILASGKDISQDEIDSVVQIYIIGYLDALMDEEIKNERN